MYRIVFDTQKCAWIIQLLRYQILWSTLKDQAFGDYESAAKYVRSIGLDNVYRNYHDSYASQVLGGAR